MCFPFLAAQGHAVGDSLCADEDVELAREAARAATARARRCELPIDLVLADQLRGRRARRGARRRRRPRRLDGPRHRAGAPRAYAAAIADAGTVFWNGPMGVFEWRRSRPGRAPSPRRSRRRPGTTVVGGGDSVAALTSPASADRVTHLSTGGGATLELIEGKDAARASRRSIARERR